MYVAAPGLCCVQNLFLVVVYEVLSCDVQTCSCGMSLSSSLTRDQTQVSFVGNMES